MTEVGWVCLGLLGVTGALCVVRVVRGPTMLDRTVAADVFVAATVGAIGIEAAVNRHTTTLPILVAMSLVGFLGSVSIARFTTRDDRPNEHPRKKTQA
ncbi:MAG: monovalent cation/H+ antiporter complex subunit F [Aeromicrobium sp.]|uniref:monovalent cation/H+ antiporter complex subunit F n=1 Tax=Aeromicrobium sp. TaxID=1871063 RepID=UPI0039E2F982